MPKTFYIIRNKQSGVEVYSTSGKPFTSKTGALNSFIYIYRNRKRYKEFFIGVPKGGVYSQTSTEKVKEIFNKYFEIIQL